MTVRTITQPPFVVDAESERDSSWPDKSIVFCKDTNKLYRLDAGAWMSINPAQAQSDWTQSDSSAADFIKHKLVAGTDYAAPSSVIKVWVSGTQKTGVKAFFTSATVSGGSAAFALTESGAAVFASVYAAACQFITFDTSNQFQYGTPVLSGDKKTLTVPVTRIVLSLGVIVFSAAANGTTVYAQVFGD